MLKLNMGLREEGKETQYRIVTRGEQYMKIKKTAVVCTTINLPTFLEKYNESFEAGGVTPDEVVFIVVGDTKSKASDKKYAQLCGENYEVEFWDVVEQGKWIRKNYPEQVWDDIEFVIPHNSVRRRNFGYLRALELGTDLIITIDDDNLPIDEDWLKGHTTAFKRKDHHIVSSRNRIVNPCRILRHDKGFVYSRGYPISELFNDSFMVSRNKYCDKRVVLNMGLWNNKPDVDAYTNIAYPDLLTSGFNRYEHRFAIHKNNYFPINTQNTAFLPEVTPAFYVLKMNPTIHGVGFDRYDDIWAGWILQKLAHTLGDTATFGLPLTNHDRNTHSFQKDLSHELIGIALNKRVYDRIVNANIKTNNYKDGYLQMANVIENTPTSNPEVGGVMDDMAEAMRIWVKLTEMWI